MIATHAHIDRWYGFEAAHIFPLAFLDRWNEYGFDDLPGLVPPAKSSHGFINSVMNGIMLQANLHYFFDSYEITINPDV